MPDEWFQGVSGESRRAIALEAASRVYSGAPENDTFVVSLARTFEEYLRDG